MSSALRLVAGALALLALVSCSAQFGAPTERPLAYRQGEDAFRLGDYERAATAYRVFVRGGGRKDDILRAYYKWALAESRLGNYERALEVLSNMEARFAGELGAHVRALQGDAESARGNLLSALRYWEQGWSEAEGEQRRRLGRRMNDAMAAMSVGSLSSAISLLEEDEIRRRAREVLERKRIDAGVRARERVADTRPEAGPDSFPPGTRPRLAALLPLSGPYRPYGQRTLNGLRLGLGAEADSLLVRDTAGRPELARAAVDTLAAREDVVAVIGPLRSSVAELAAPRAEKAALPMVTLAQRASMQGQFVLSMALTPARQAEALASIATGSLRAGRVAVLHPDDSYGRAFAEEFRRHLVRAGGTLIGVLAYSPGAREFGVERLTVEQWLRQDDLQAVLLPDQASIAAPLATELRDISPSLTLLGNNGWNDPEILADHMAALEGAVFVDGFFAGSGRPASRSFVRAYRAAYGEPPALLEAQAFDAARLLSEVVRSGVASRAEMARRLRDGRRFEGATGTIEVGATGIEREVFLLQIRNGQVHEIGIR